MWVLRSHAREKLIIGRMKNVDDNAIAIFSVFFRSLKNSIDNRYAGKMKIYENKNIWKSVFSNVWIIILFA